MSSEMVTGSYWTKLEANRSIQQRLGALKLRTTLTAIVALASGFFGAWVIAQPLASLCRIGYGTLFQRGDFPLVHTPIDSQLYSGYSILELTFLTVAVLTILGASVGTFGRARTWQLLLPSLCLGWATLFFVPPTTSWLGVFPSKLERAITLGDFDAAREILKEAGPNETVSQYIQAQIALRAHDLGALKSNAGHILKLADEWGAGQIGGSVRDNIERKRAVNFKPEILYSFDLALNGRAQTKVAKQWEKDSHPTFSRSLWLTVILPFAFGCILMVVALWLIPLWNGMRRRIREIQIGLAPEVKEDQAWDRPWSELLSKSDFLNSSFSLSRVLGGLGLVIGSAIVILPEAIKVISWVGGFRSVVSHVTISDNPCDYVGVWTAAQKRGVYKTTLLADGRFFSTPIAAGTTSGWSYEGEWSVDSGSMIWRYDSQLDVNKIKEASRTHFTLKERDGELTEFNLIEAQDVTGCSKNANWISIGRGTYRE